MNKHSPFLFPLFSLTIIITTIIVPHFYSLKSKSFHYPISSFFMELKPTKLHKKTNQTVPSHPLFSTIITLYIIILLYFPSIFLKFFFSPIFISTTILLILILKLGSTQNTQKEFIKNSTQFLPQQQTHDSVTDLVADSDRGYDPDAFCSGPFVDYWNVRAPLEIIYEAYEGEDEDDRNDVVLEEGIERYPSLSMYYPESDTDSSSEGDFPVTGEWGSPEKMGFRWDDEDRDGLIEIDLDGKRSNRFFNFEEDNLIEIDISCATND